MEYHNPEHFFRKLILGKNQFISSTSVFKRAMLTGYLSIMVVGITFGYLLFDVIFNILDALHYYLIMFLLAGGAFALNRSGYFNLAKILLLCSTLLIITLFGITEPTDSGNYFNLFPVVIGAFALFDFRRWYYGVLFTVLSIGVFIVIYVFEFINIHDTLVALTTNHLNFLLHFLFSICASLLIIVFLIKLNHQIETNLLKNENNLNRVAKELETSNKRFELAISGSNAGIYDWDIKNNSIYHSPMWKRMLGYEAEELEVYSISDFFAMVHPDDLTTITRKLTNHTEEGTRYSEEVRLRTKQGFYRWFIDAGQAHWDSNGIAIRMVGSLVDIHERKMAEEKIKSQNQILEKTNSELDYFVYSTSHDLRSPLLSVLGLINIAEKSGDLPEILYCLSLMKTRIFKLDEFISDIIDFSKNSRLDVLNEEIKLKHFIEEIVDELSFMDKDQKIKIRYNFDEDFMLISDKVRLKIIIKNLISNAFRYHSPYKKDPFIRLDAALKENDFVFSVTDNGEGVKPELKDKIFQMFFRGSEKSKGAGLGLYIVKETVEKLGGEITVHTVFDEGCKFTMKLPHDKSQINIQKISQPSKIKTLPVS